MSSLLDIATRIDLIVPTDSPRTFYWQRGDENGTNYDFTGSTFSLSIKARNANDEPTGSILHTLTTGSGIAGDVSIGEFQPTIPKSSAWSTPSPAGDYIYEVLRLVSGVAVEPFQVGILDVEQGLS